MENYYFTSEAVTEGHPDKICDKIADTILDVALSQDPDSKMAIEATIKDEFILIYGEMKTKANIEFEKIAKATLKNIGYDDKFSVYVKVGMQSKEISEAVHDTNESICAGDQGIMFGYACEDTEVLMPAAIYYANQLAKKLSEVSKKSDILKPDGKTQVTVEYENGIFKRISNIVISAQHIEATTQSKISDLIINEVVKKIIPERYIDGKTTYLINPSGSFIKGGSFGDSGTTGRKIVCDSYGGYGRVGGGCFSSKDPSKVDRSAAYYCRYVAKSIVANKLASKCEIGVSYAIGRSKPLSIFLETYGTNKYPEENILETIEKNFDFSVANIITELNLKRPIYSATSNYGHFGNENFPWEKIKFLK